MFAARGIALKRLPERIAKPGGACECLSQHTENDARGAGAITGKLENIQALRALAVFLVILIHAQVNELRSSADPLLSPWLYHGVSGVDVFFVISGFIMVWITRGRFGRLPSVAHFLYGRATRIYPAAWLWTTMALLAFLAAGTLDEWLERSSVIASYLLLPHDPATSPLLLGVSWTLVHELYFYLVFALFLLGPERLLPLWLALWAVLVGLGRLADWETLNATTALVLHPLTYEFIAGAGVGLALTRMKPRWGEWIFLAGVIIFFAGWLALGERGPRGYPDEWGRVLAFGPGAVLMVWGAAAMDMQKGWRAPAWLSRIGDWSYSLYLCNLLVIATLSRLWTPWAADGVWDNLIMLAAMITLPVAVAWAAYAGFEKPVLGMTRAWGPKR